LCEESRPLWPLSVPYLFIWNDKYFGQPLPQIAIDREDSSAARAFFSTSPAHRRDTILQPCALFLKCASSPNGYTSLRRFRSVAPRQHSGIGVWHSLCTCNEK
jgi:hypothetical protein